MNLPQVQSPDSPRVSNREAAPDYSWAIQDPASKYVTRLLLAGAVVLLAAIARKAWLDIDTGWDSLAYHMQFAALRVGFITQQQYHLSNWISGYYDGFPVLPDYLQGILWRLTGRPQAANLASFLGLLCVTGFFRLRYRVPFGYIVVALVGIPVVMIQSTSTFVDLFTNCFATILLFIIFKAWVDPAHFSALDGLGAFLSLAITMNSKEQFVVVGTTALFGLILVGYVYRAQFVLLRHQLLRGPAWKRWVLLLGCFLLLCAAYINPAKNLVRFHNPVYPVSVNIGALHLPGKYPVNGGQNDPKYLSHSSQWVRWLLSVTEFDAFDGRPLLWTNGQGDVKLNSRALRMGGYFGALVVFNVFFFLILQARSRRRLGLKPLGFLAAITVVTAVLPASHELRYYMYWAMCLVALNLIIIEDGLTGPERDTFRLVAGAAASSFLLFVLCATGFQYVHSTGTTVETLVRDYAIDKELSNMQLHEGETICVEDKNPRDFLYAPMFHLALESEYHYRVREAYVPQDCMGNRVVP
jgi:hypothetical protein